MMGDHHSFFFLFVFLLLVYFIWMDLALYYKLQSGYDDLLSVQEYQKSTTSTSTPTINTNVSFYDPFSPISVKLLMLDHLNHYVYYPLCHFLDSKLLHISDRLFFITPDMISLSHVAVAAVGAKCISNADSLSQRRLGVILFELRSMLDSYDGIVARARRNVRGLTQVSGNWGYWMDGICDAAGTLLFFFAAWILLQKKGFGCNGRHSGGQLLPTISSRSASRENLLHVEEEAAPFIKPTYLSTPVYSKFRLATWVVLALVVQQFFSSLFWNRYMEGFHNLLERPGNLAVKNLQVADMKSTPFWIISWSWKLFNPHAQMSILLAFVFFDVAGKSFFWLRYLGFLPLATLVLSSETYMQFVSSQIASVTSLVVNS